MNDYPTTLRVIAAFKAGEDLAQRLESAVKAQNAMADALRNAADEIERLEELRKLDGESIGVLIAECQDMKDRLVNGDQTEPLHNGFAGYTEGISAIAESNQSHEKSDEKRMNANTIRLTAEEREAIEWFSQLSYGEGGRVPDYAATLRKLLERTK